MPSKIFFLVFFFFIITSPSFGQEKYLYQVMNNVMDLEKPISYVGFVNQFKRQETKRMLDSLEGGDGYKVEFNLWLKFPVLQKKVVGLEDPTKKDDTKNELFTKIFPWEKRIKDDSIRPFFGYSRLWVDYGFHTRVSKNVESSPILPPTNRYGFRFDKMLIGWVKNENDRRGNQAIDGMCFRKDDAYPINPSDKLFQMLFLSVNRHHYSNSQPKGVFKDNDSTKGNNYTSGDFSTNYWRYSLSYYRYKFDKHLLGVTIGYQHDFGDSVGMFKFIPEQNKRYGKHRLVSTIQYQWALCQPIWRSINQLRARIDIEYILDSKKLTYYLHENRWPLGVHSYFEVPFYKVNSLAILFHGYYGRDYLNIRYDDPIFAFQIGLSLDISRFTLTRKDEEPAIN